MYAREASHACLEGTPQPIVKCARPGFKVQAQNRELRPSLLQGSSAESGAARAEPSALGDSLGFCVTHPLPPGSHPSVVSVGL